MLVSKALKVSYKLKVKMLLYADYKGRSYTNLYMTREVK